eukprot:gene8110-biopygen6811
MAPPTFRRSGGSARDTAEAAFRSATTKPVEQAAKAPVIPNARESVSLRIDSDILEHFQSGGPGWQERINQALRKVMTDAA